MKQFFKSLFLSAFAVTLFSTVSYASPIGNNSVSPYEEVFKSAVHMPSFPGGDVALMSFINKNIRYPKAAQDNGIQGKVIVQFVVEKDGSIGEVKVARGVDSSLDQEAVRVCKLLPHFSPGRNGNGDPVRVWYTLPVTFFIPEDPSVSGEALKYYQDALNGDANAQYSLGNCYYDGKGVNRDYKRAVYWFKKSAEQGNINAQGFLGWCYENEEGVIKDYNQAVYWYSKSAEQGNANACNNLGRCYESGYGVEEDYDQAVYWYRKAANGGNAYGMNNLGECYYYGNGVEQDFEQAFQLFYKAANRDIPRAQNNLAECYYNGTGVAQNIERAIYWYSKAAEQGNENAIKKLPSAYALIKDYDNAHKWYQKAYNIDDEIMENCDTGCLLYNIANNIYLNKNYLPILLDAVNQESPGAIYTLACLYAAGKDVEQDDKKAVELYRQYLDAKGRPNKKASIADVYYEICNNYSSIIRSIKYPQEQWLHKAAELGHSDAQYNLGDYYYYYAEDYENALVWWKKAAANNSSDAMRMIGDCYEKGLGVALDHKTAFQWYKKAADNGDYISQNFIGKCYLKGDVESRNEKKAAKYFTMSAENGNEEAKYNLGKCFYEGKGTKKDYKQAAEWFAEVCEVYLKPLEVTELNIVADELVLEPPKTIDLIYEDERAIGGSDDITKHITKSEEEYNAWTRYELLKQHYDENALLWLENAAEGGNKYAVKHLVNLYCYGQGVERDYNKALYWYKMVDQETLNIGEMLYKMARDDYDFDISSDLSLMKQSADFGNKDALSVMAALYAIGNGVTRNDAKAIEYYKKYINEPTATISDVYYLIYNSYNGIIQNSYNGERDQWLDKAVELGNADAQYEMGNLSDDYEDAVIWYRKAAEQGHAEAQCEMGNYYNDKGDYAQAAQWFIKAAAQDEPEAQYRLASLYSTGKGVKKDKLLAGDYYYKSATGFKASAEKTLGKE